MTNVNEIATERGRINQAIREFFLSRGYLEVETPIVVRSPGMEPNLSPFETVVCEPNGICHKAGLITSPEYSMKKLLGQGMEKIFTISKVFRNEEELGGEHNPEFSMLEWYRQGADYLECMDETEELIKEVGSLFESKVEKIERVRMRDLFFDLAGVDLDIASEDDLRNRCNELELRIDESDTQSDLFFRLFLNKVEPTFKDRNVFVYDYPIYQAALSKISPDGKYAERFELYLNGLELCNGFTELTDPAEQRQRFIEEADERRGQGKPVFPIDEKLLNLLSSLEEPTFGNALGIDRLHMFATGKSKIQEVLLFPASKLFE